MYILIPLSIVLIKWFPEYGRYWNHFGGEGLNIGAADGKNGLGLLCAVAGLFFFWDLLIIWRNRKISLDQIALLINILFLAMISYLFILVDSQTSLGSLIIGIIILLNLSLIREKIKYIGFFIFHIVLIIIVILSTDLINMVIETMGRDPTLTGRSEVWEYLMQIYINPLVGTGYSSFWTGQRLDQIWRDFWWHPKQAHNGYLETYLNLGIIGLMSLFAIIISLYKNNKKVLAINFDMGKFRMAIFFMVIIYNWTEAAFIVSSPLWFLFLFTIIQIPKPTVVSDREQYLVYTNQNQ
jgi:O-antigen ligase